MFKCSVQQFDAHEAGLACVFEMDDRSFRLFGLRDRNLRVLVCPS